MWILKILIQFVISKLPKAEQINYLFQKINNSHNKDKMGRRIINLITSLNQINNYKPLKGAKVVEVGTGWDPICSVLLYLMGVKICHTYDHLAHVRYSLIERLVDTINQKLTKISEITKIELSILEKRLSQLRETKNLHDFFQKANIVYHAPGDASETNLEKESIDLVYSHAVLEHVPKKVVYDLTKESKRVLRKNGLLYHCIGLGDHYHGVGKNVSKVNFLKFSEFWWSFFIHNRISYHNRMREKEFISIFEEFEANVLWKKNKIDAEDIEVLKKMKIDKAFDGMTYEELAVWETEMILGFN